MCDVRLQKHRDSIAQVYPEHNRWRGTSQASTILGGLQPFIAWLGMIGCLVIVFVFTTATWWSTPVDFSKVAIAYGAVRYTPTDGVMRGLLTSNTNAAYHTHRFLPSTKTHDMETSRPPRQRLCCTSRYARALKIPQAGASACISG